MKKIIAILVFALSINSSSAQINLESILEGGVNDAANLLKGYLEPIPTGFGYGLNGGWYSTAKAHKMFGFDIKVIANASLVPTSGETFTFNEADYTSIKLDGGNGSSSAELPTIFGSRKLADRPLLEFNSGTSDAISTSSLPGSGLKEAIGFNAVPSAMVQIGVGLFKNTDLKIRFIPKLSVDDYEFSTFGVGVMHDLKQWVPFVNKLPFDVSALLAWNSVKSKFILDSDLNQALEFNTNTSLYQIVASKKLSILTLFGGVGVSSFNSDANVLGTYTTSESNTTYIDPVALNYSGSSFVGNLGLNLKLLVFNLSADYAIQEYNTFTVTAGFSFR